MKKDNAQKIVELNFIHIEKNKEYLNLIERVLEKAFQQERLNYLNIYINVILTDPSYIRLLNKDYRGIDKETDVLSFPIFDKQEIEERIQFQQDFPAREVLGDIIISVHQVEEQAKEYGHSFNRELAYMLVHGFYHLMGYDHIQEEDKKIMREKEENVLKQLDIHRDDTEK